MRGFTIIITLAVFSAHAESTEKILDQLQKSYDRISTIEADFEQVYRSKRFDDKKARGKVYLKKPGLMFWEYTEPKGRVMASDGKKLTLYDPEDRQAIVTELAGLKDLPVPLSFLWGKEKISDSFHVHWDPTKKILELTPRKEITNVSKVELTLKEGEYFLVVGSLVTDALGGESELKFLNLRTDQKFPVDRFAYQPPKSVPIVQMDLGASTSKN